MWAAYIRNNRETPGRRAVFLPHFFLNPRIRVVRIYIDFDGTITERDVGDSIFERFLRPELLSGRDGTTHIIREGKGRAAGFRANASPSNAKIRW